MNYIERAVAGRIDLLSVMGLVKLPPQSGGVGKASWEAFKKRHNVRYQYLEQERRCREREGGGNG